MAHDLGDGGGETVVSRAHHYHLIKAATGEPELWCGESASWAVRFKRATEDPMHRRLCPDCSRAYFGDRLKVDPNGYSISPKGLNEQEREVAAGSKWTYRAMFPVTGPDGEVVGFISLRNGFGRGYAFTPWRVRHGEDEAYAPQDLKVWSDEGIPRDYDSNVSFISKEQALFLMPKIAETGATLTKAAVEAEARREREEEAERRRQRSIQEEENRKANAARLEQDGKDTAHIREAFIELLASQDVTNFQREGLVLAAKRLRLGELI